MKISSVRARALRTDYYHIACDREMEAPEVGSSGARGKPAAALLESQNRSREAEGTRIPAKFLRVADHLSAWARRSRANALTGNPTLTSRSAMSASGRFQPAASRKYPPFAEG